LSINKLISKTGKIN